jgi:hypothetical protein
VTSSKHLDMFLGNSGLCYKVQLYYIACGFLALAGVLVFAVRVVANLNVLLGPKD